MVWWLIVAAVGSYVLVKTKWGNWIFAVGGNKDAARAVGVPANQVKIGLVMTVSSAAVCGNTDRLAVRHGAGQPGHRVGVRVHHRRGRRRLSADRRLRIRRRCCAGLAIMAISVVGHTKWNSDGRFAFLGVLLRCRLVNNFIRKKAQEAR